MRPSLVAALLLVAGCTRTMHVRVDAPHTDVLLDGTDIGPVPEQGIDVEVRPGMKPLAYEVKNGKQSAVGAVPRSDAVWWMLALAVGGAACCAPSLAAGGFCLANPGVIGAPLAFAASGDVGTLTSACVAPSWFTLPAVAGCGALGLSPLALGLVAEQVPPSIVLAPRALEEKAPAAPPGVAF